MAEVPKTDGFKLWDTTGDIVVAAIGPWHRVHSEVLFSQTSLSSVDRFIPADQDGTNYSVIMLNDDSKDVYYFLKALYMFGQLCNEIDDPVPLLSALSLATKYEADSLRLQLLDKLAFWYPTTLEGWDNYWRTHDSVWELMSTNRPLHYQMSFTAARILREAGALHLLRTAYVRCCERPLEHIMHGFRTNRMTYELADEDKRIVLAALQPLTCMAQNAFPLLFGVPPAEACQKRTCSAYRDQMKQIWWLTNADNFSNPVKHVFDKQWEVDEMNLCESCCKEIRDAYDTNRIVAWRSMAWTFGLAGVESG